MTRTRKGHPRMPASQYAANLTGLTVNLLVRDVAGSLPFYIEVLELKALYSDSDFAALEGGPGVRIMLHAAFQEPPLFPSHNRCPSGADDHQPAQTAARP